MPRKTAKRSRSPSSSDSTATPPPKTKKPRTSKTAKSTSSTRRTSGIKHSSTASEGQAEKDDTDVTASASSPSSSLQDQDQDSDEDEDVIKHSTSKSNSNSDANMKHKKEVIIAMVDRMDPKQLKRILEDSAKYLQKGGTYLDNPEKDDAGDVSKVRNIWERVMENWDDSEEEDEMAVEEEAEKLANALAAPFDKLQAQSTSSLNEVTYTVNQAFQNALKPFKNDIILEQLKLCEAAQAKLAHQTAERWDIAMAHVAHKKKFHEIMRQIHAINEEKKQLIEQAKKDFDAALERQAAEIEGFKKRIRESQERCREQLIKAQDQDRINKEVNMLMAKFLNGDRT